MNSELVVKLPTVRMKRVSRIVLSYRTVNLIRRGNNLPPAQNGDACKAVKRRRYAENTGERLQFKSRTNPSGHSQRNKDANHLPYPLGIRKSVEAIFPSCFRNLTHKGEFIS